MLSRKHRGAPLDAQAARIDDVDRRVAVVGGIDQVSQPVQRGGSQPFADDDQRLAPFAQRGEVHRAGFDGRHGDLGADALDVAHVHDVRVLDTAARRIVDASPADELADLLGQVPPVAREADGLDRQQRIHDRDQIGRAERVEDDAREILARAKRADERADVVLVPENQEDAHVVTRRFRRRVSRVADLQRHVVVGRSPGRFDQLEGRDLLRQAVVPHLEVGRRQRGDGIPAAIDDRDVDANEIRAGAEGWRPRRLGLGILPARP